MNYSLIYSLPKEGNLTTVFGKCPHCFADWRLQVKTLDFLFWKDSSMSPDEAFPYLNKESKEYFDSGTCKSCQKKLLCTK